MTNIKKIAAQDAANYARAMMFFGEGAGTRRKHVTAEIATKVERVPGYHEAFEKALGKQDMGEHAIKAQKERKSLDRKKAVSRNTRGLITGNKASLTTGVGVVVVGWGLARELGLDEPIKAEVKKAYGKTKAKVVKVKAHIRVKHARFKLRNSFE